MFLALPAAVSPTNSASWPPQAQNAHLQLASVDAFSVNLKWMFTPAGPKLI